MQPQLQYGVSMPILLRSWNEPPLTVQPLLPILLVILPAPSHNIHVVFPLLHLLSKVQEKKSIQWLKNLNSGNIKNTKTLLMT